MWNLSFLATGIPRPHQWLLMGVQACRVPGLKRLKRLQTVTRLKPLKRFKPLKLAKAFRNAQPRRHKLPQGQIHRFFAPKTLQTVKTCKSVSERPTAQAQAIPRPDPSLLLSAVQPVVRQALAANDTLRPHQWLLMGVQACRLPAPKL